MIDSRADDTKESSQDGNQFRYEVDTIETAKAIILTPDDRFTTEDRWEKETKGVVELTKDLIPIEGCVVDFGVGIGRILRALAEVRPDLKLIGVDSSKNAPID
jgi:tRNA G46 methylase TrmB